MSLEAALEANTAAIKELTAALLAAGALQQAQDSAAAHASPAVQAVVRAQKEADAKQENDAKKEATPTTAVAQSAASGEPSAPTPTKSSVALKPWHEKTAEAYAGFKDTVPTFDTVRNVLLTINRLIGREQAEAVLARFGAQTVTSKADKKGLDESRYGDFLALCIEVLAGRVDATAAIVE